MDIRVRYLVVTCELHVADKDVDFKKKKIQNVLKQTLISKKKKIQNVLKQTQKKEEIKNNQKYPQASHPSAVKESRTV